MVPRTGVEPVRPCGRRILSPLRLPIPPPGQGKNEKWRLGSESNRRPRLCRPLHNHSATQPSLRSKTKPRRSGALFRHHSGAGNETRTRDPNLGKVVLYQLSYSRWIFAPEAISGRSPPDFRLEHVALRGGSCIVASALRLSRNRSLDASEWLTSAELRPGQAQIVPHRPQGHDGGGVDQYATQHQADVGEKRVMGKD